MRPWAAVCYPGAESNATACSAVQAGYTNGFQRSNQQGSLQLSVPPSTLSSSRCERIADIPFDDSLNWEECAGQSCLLNTFAPQQPQVGTCYQGRIPPYSVTVNTPLDAIKAIDFAVLNRIKIVIKNTGHEYLGRSSGKDGLQIWTHKLKTMTHYPQFQADGCKGPSADAITIGSGSQAGQGEDHLESFPPSTSLTLLRSVRVRRQYWTSRHSRSCRQCRSWRRILDGWRVRLDLLVRLNWKLTMGSADMDLSDLSTEWPSITSCSTRSS